MFWSPKENEDFSFLSKRALGIVRNKDGKNPGLKCGFHNYIIMREKTQYSKDYTLRIYKCKDSKGSGCEAKIYERIPKTEGLDPSYRKSFETHSCEIINRRKNFRKMLISPPPIREIEDNRGLRLPYPPTPIISLPPAKYFRTDLTKAIEPPKRITKKIKETRRDSGGEIINPKSPNSNNFSSISPQSIPLQQSSRINTRIVNKLIEVEQNENISLTNENDPQLFTSIVKKVTGKKRKRSENELNVYFYPVMGNPNKKEQYIDIYCNFDYDEITRIILSYPFERRLFVSSSKSDLQITEIKPTVIKRNDVLVKDYFYGELGDGKIIRKETEFINFIIDHPLMIRCKINCSTLPELNSKCEIKICIPNGSGDVNIVKAKGLNNQKTFNFIENFDFFSPLQSLSLFVEEEKEKDEWADYYRHHKFMETSFYESIEEITGINGYESNDFFLPKISDIKKHNNSKERNKNNNNNNKKISTRTDACGLNLLHYASAHGDLGQVKFLVEEKGFVVNKIDYFGHIAIHYASFHVRKECYDFLMSVGSASHVKNVFGHRVDDCVPDNFRDIRYLYPKRSKNDSYKSISRNTSRIADLEVEPPEPEPIAEIVNDFDDETYEDVPVRRSVELIDFITEQNTGMQGMQINRSRRNASTRKPPRVRKTRKTPKKKKKKAKPTPKKKKTKKGGANSKGGPNSNEKTKKSQTPRKKRRRRRAVTPHNGEEYQPKGKVVINRLITDRVTRSRRSGSSSTPTPTKNNNGIHSFLINHQNKINNNNNNTNNSNSNIISRSISVLPTFKDVQNSNMKRKKGDTFKPPPPKKGNISSFSSNLGNNRINSKNIPIIRNNQKIPGNIFNQIRKK